MDYVRKYLGYIVLIAVVCILIYALLHQKEVVRKELNKEYKKDIKQKNDSINLLQIQFLDIEKEKNKLKKEKDSIINSIRNLENNIVTIHNYYDKERFDIDNMSELELIEYFTTNVSARDSV